MLDSAILDVAIGLAFIFLLVSLLVTTLSEMIAGWLKWRSTFLWNGLARLLQSDTARNELYKHPLIKGLADVDPNDPRWLNGRNGPSYIPSRTFALALIDVLRRPQQAADDVERRLHAAVDSATDPAKAIANVTAIIEEVEKSDAPARLKQDLLALKAGLQTQDTSQAAADAMPRVIRQVQEFTEGAAARWLRDANRSMQGTVDALQPLLYDAAGDIDRFRENVEVWFNNGMDRVSGWYKRHITVVHAIVAGILAVVMNIDALQITRTLWREPTLRQSLVANATTFVNEREVEVVDPNPQSILGVNGRTLTITADKVRLFPDDVAKFTVASDPAGEAVALTVKRDAPNVLLSPPGGSFSVDSLSLVSGNQSAEFFVKALQTPSTKAVRLTVSTAAGQQVDPQLIITPQEDARFAALREQIATLGLPIGWSCPQDAKLTADPSSVGGPFWCSAAPGRLGQTWFSASWWAIWFVEILSMVLGWLITAAAASLGAPFWFDLLKRFISIRSGGKAPEERPLSPKQVPQPLEPGQRPREADFLDALGR